jgi:peptidoglycan/LPS O-acetylase OafA/YrhL
VLSQEQPLTESKYRLEIDGLRAIAILLVLGFHNFPQIIKGGFVGVDIFFVISGYLISTIIFQEIEDGTFSYLSFYSRRIKRIFPALITILIVCLVFGYVFAFPDEFMLFGKHIAGSTLFIMNIILYREAGYFDSASELKPLLHLWAWNRRTILYYLAIIGWFLF